MNNITTISKNECCGCTACEMACTFGAISMLPDHEGFLYPIINNELCTNCGACLNICNTDVFYHHEQKIFASWSKDDTLRSKSSSGGVFSSLANLVLNNNGAVSGVGYSSSFDEVLHKLIQESDQIDDLRRSKFVQSVKYDIYRKVKQYLQKGKPLLFTGTPCEVGGLKQYLHKDYENLFTCDIICGCVSSPKVYRKYIEFIENKYNSKVVSVNFKDKRNGWREKAIAIKFENGEEYYNSILDDDYCVSFHSRFNIRPSCFNCKYRNLNRVSDITLGDFWAIEKYDNDYDDDKGISFLLANTIKGEKYIMKMEQMEVHQMNIDFEDYSLKYNWCMHKNPIAPSNELRDIFYNDLNNMPFELMAEKNLSKIKEERKQKKTYTK